ncbi:MAG: CapA family protein [Bacteroidales bacterium]|nr:CapA family protein [Bacteroidales bacterium]MDT8431548.1 CapA family protein [Bacteroidales bacterium]
MLKYISFFSPVLLAVMFSCSGTRQVASAPGEQEINGTAGDLTREAAAGISRDTTPQEICMDTLSRYDSVFLSLQDPGSVYAEALARLEPETLCIIGTGDIMPGTDYPDVRYLPPGNDCAALFDPVREVLASADVTFGNLEGVFSSDGGTAKHCNDPSVCYVFRMPDAYLSYILDAGYDLLSVANNHVNDFGAAGRANTARLLEEAGVPFAGFRSHPYTTFEKNGVTYGFAAFAPHTGTVDLKDYAGAAAIVAMLDSISDVVIVSFHGGAEGRDYQHVPCTDEVFLGHNRGNVCAFARTVVDAGADVVFGHGPHVIRGMELYKDRLICYSLGNFCTYARFNLSGPNGLAPVIKVYTAPDGSFLEGKIIPMYQPGEGGPRPDPLNRAITMLQELSAADFPDSPLVIETNGTFYAE